MIGPCADPRHIKRGWNLVLFFITPIDIMSSSRQPTAPTLSIEELRVRRQAEKEERERRQREEDEAFEEELRRLVEEEERRKREEEEERRWKLEEMEQEWLRQKELEKARKEKRKAVEISEDNGDEAELSGSNKKVSHNF